MRFMWVAVIGCVVGSPSRADGLREALAAHTAAVARIRTISYQFSLTSNHTGRVERQDGEYLRSGDDQRVLIRQGDARFAEYVTGERQVTTSQQPANAPGKLHLRGGIRPNAGYISSAATPHPWAASLLALSSKRGPASQPLDEHVAEYLAGPTTRMVDGLVVITGANGWATIRLDPKHNYLVCGQDTNGPVDANNPSGRTITTTERITGFQEVAPGLYFPTGYVSEQRVGDAPPIRQTATFTAVKVNERVDPAAFKPKYVDGTPVTDLIRGTEYVVDSDGNPKGAEKPRTTLAAGVGNPNTTDVTVSGPTVEEDRRGGWWLLPAGLSVLLAGLAVGLWRRRR